MPYSVDVVMWFKACHCVKKFIIHNSTNVKKDKEHIWTWFLIFWPRRRWGLLQGVLLSFWGFLYTHIITCDCLWKEFWLSFKPLLKALSCAVMTLFLLPSQQMGHKLAAIWLLFRLTLKTLWTDSKWPSEHVSNFMYSDSSLSEDKFLHSINIFVCFAHWWMFHKNGIFNRSYTVFELVKPLKTCVLPLVSFLNLFSTFQSSQHSALFNSKFDADMLLSCYCDEEDENCSLLVYYAASSGNFLMTCRGNLSAPSPGVKNPKGPKICCSFKSDIF